MKWSGSKSATCAEAPSESSGSSTSWTTASFTVARRRTTRIGPSTFRRSSRTCWPSRWPPAPRPCPATVSGTYSVATVSRNSALRRPGAKLVDVARRAGVSTGTVSNVLNRPEAVAEETRLKVLAAVAELGYVRGGIAEDRQRAAALASYRVRNVALSAGRYRLVPEEGAARGASGACRGRPLARRPRPWAQRFARAQACWLPVAPGLTPHGLRHTHKTLMVELGTPAKLMDERMGHEDGSVQARYSHVTAEMRRRLVGDSSNMWEAALDQRRRLSSRSPVAVLDALTARAAADLFCVNADACSVP